MRVCRENVRVFLAVKILKKKINYDNSLMRKVAGKKMQSAFSTIFVIRIRTTIPKFPDDTVIVSETIWSYGNDHVVARKSSSGRSIDGRITLETLARLR